MLMLLRVGGYGRGEIPARRRVMLNTGQLLRASLPSWRRVLGLHLEFTLLRGPGNP
jgi:hypothetical protein